MNRVVANVLHPAKPDVPAQKVTFEFDPLALHGPRDSRNGDYGIRARNFAAQSAFILAARTTLPHFSVSSANSFPKSAGEPTSTVPAQIGKPRPELGVSKAS